MCIATALAIAAAGAGVVGSIGAIKAGNAQGNALKYNALVEQQNATATLAGSNAQAAQRERDNTRRTAAARSAYGASGIDPNSGTPLAVMADLAGEGELSKRLILYQGQLEAQGLQQKSALDLTQAKVARQAGYFNAASTLLTAGMRAGAPYAGPSTPPAAPPSY